jgi:STE24 endopeptidase
MTYVFLGDVALTLNYLYYNCCMETVALDLERQKQAKLYSRISRRLMLVDLGLTGLYALGWLALGWSASLKAALTGFTSSPWLLVLLFAAVFGGIFYLIDLPLSYYSGYILPHRFGQKNETLRGWIGDQVKGLLIGGILGGIVLEVIYAVLRAFPDTWWIWAAAILLVFSVLMANLAPVLLFPIFYKFVPLGEEHQDLADRLVRLGDRAGTKVKGVYKFDMSRRTKSANAALTGLGATRRIILGDTLIEEFSTDEIETVLAHELGHHVNKDIPLSIVIETISTVVGLFLASLALRWGVGQFGFSGVDDVAALPLFMLVMGVYGLVTMPLTNAFSRWREVLADRYALESTHNPTAFASAMTRLANQNLSEVDPEPWVEFLLYSHPALEKRIKMAQAFEKNPGVTYSV